MDAAIGLLRFSKQRCIGYQRSGDGGMWAIIKGDALFEDGSTRTLYKLSKWPSEFTEWQDHCPVIDLPQPEKSNGE